MGDASKARQRLGWAPHVSFDGLVKLMYESDLAEARQGRGRGKPTSTAVGGAPLVGVIMGSDSDLGVMRGAVDVLDEFGVPSEARVSAHRTPQASVRLRAVGGEPRPARDHRGRRWGRAPAGDDRVAHALPVIGVPVPLQHLDGLDSLLSIVQMPNGTPSRPSPSAVRNAGLRCASWRPPTPTSRNAWSFQAGLADLVRQKDAELRDDQPFD